MCAEPERLIAADELGELAAAIRHTHRAHLRELRIELTEGGVILLGRAASYYGKQMAQQEVFQRGLVVAANEVAVELTVASPVALSPFPQSSPELRKTMVAFVHPSNVASVQIVEAVGVSEESWRDAVWQAVASVINPVRRLVSMEMVRNETLHTDGPTFRVVVKVAYTPVAKQPNRTRRPLVVA